MSSTNAGAAASLRLSISELVGTRLSSHDTLCNAFFDLSDPVIRSIHLAAASKRRAMAQREGPTLVVKDFAHFKFIFDVSSMTDFEMLEKFKNSDFYERSTAALIEAELRQGGSFVDVGANSGYFTLLAATIVGTSGRVWAVEPFQASLTRLKRNLALNNIQNVHVIEMAAYSSKQRMPLYVSSDGDGMNSVTKIERHSEVVQIDAIPLDEIIDDNHVSLMKIDVEGAEVDVLKGANRLVSKSSCKIIVEWNKLIRRSPSDWDRRFRYFKQLGSMYVISDNDKTGYQLRGPVTDRKNLPPWCNLLLIA